jgi:hypothetical protein
MPREHPRSGYSATPGTTHTLLPPTKRATQRDRSGENDHVTIEISTVIVLGANYLARCRVRAPLPLIYCPRWGGVGSSSSSIESLRRLSRLNHRLNLVDDLITRPSKCVCGHRNFLQLHVAEAKRGNVACAGPNAATARVPPETSLKQHKRTSAHLKRPGALRSTSSPRLLRHGRPAKPGQRPASRHANALRALLIEPPLDWSGLRLASLTAA